VTFAAYFLKQGTGNMELGIKLSAPLPIKTDFLVKNGAFLGKKWAKVGI
jgi:hypothetical protein